MAEKIHDFSDAELIKKLAEARDSIFQIRFQHATGQLEDSSQIRKTKKTIAKLETVLREREIKAYEESK